MTEGTLAPLTMTTAEVREVLPEFMRRKMPTLIVGEPGIGKTALADAVTNELGADLEVFFPATDDPTDYKGLGMAAPGDVIAKFLPYDRLHKLSKAKKLTVALFDDLGQAPEGVQAPI